MKKVVAIFMILVFIGCLGQSNPEVLQEFPKTIVDNMGREVKIQEKPERIVSLAPSNTEILYAIGAGDRVVGTTEYCDYPEEALKTEKVGGFSNINVEKVVFLKPDLVFATSMHEKIVKKLEELGIPVVVLNPETVEDVLKNIELVGKATGEIENAIKLKKSLEERIDAVRREAPSEKPKVYVEGWVSTSGYGSFGPGSFVDNLISIAGGINIAANTNSQYPNLTSEGIILENPQIIVIVSGMGATTIEELKKRPGWDTIDAVKNNRIYVIDGDLLLRPGPRIVDGLEILAKYIKGFLREKV